MRQSVPRLALLTVIGCFMAIEGSAQVVRQEVAGVRNFAKIESTVACAGAITPAAIQEIKKMGFASIINLRLATEQGADIEGHTAVAKAAGIPYYHIPFSGANPDPAVVDTFLKTITAPGEMAPAHATVDSTLAKFRMPGTPCFTTCALAALPSRHATLNTASPGTVGCMPHLL